MTSPVDDDRSERSRRYPSVPVLDAVAYLELIHTGVGLGGGTRETLAQALGHSSVNGASKKKLATLVQFGFIDRDGDRYRPTDLARRILMPVSPDEKTSAIAEAVKSPSLFAEIGVAFDQQPIPTMLANILAREHGVTPTASAEVANVFRRSVEQAGLVSDGVLRWDEAPIVSESASSSAPPASPSPAAPTRRVAPVAGDGTQDYSIPLNSDGRKALIYLPTPVTSKDLDRLNGWLTYMRSLTEPGDGAE
jgi:hypothetical protein